MTGVTFHFFMRPLQFEIGVPVMIEPVGEPVYRRVAFAASCNRDYFGPLIRFLRELPAMNVLMTGKAVLRKPRKFQIHISPLVRGRFMALRTGDQRVTTFERKTGFVMIE